jgi:hypothetical protein
MDIGEFSTTAIIAASGEQRYFILNRIKDVHEDIDY